MTFSVTADGTAPFDIQWYKDGAVLAGATDSTYVLSSAQIADAGIYKAVVSNSAGSATSDDAVLTVSTVATAPSFTSQPSGQSAVAGSSVTFSATAGGSPTPTYQWRKDGTAISGATSSSYSIGSVASGHAGCYTVVATNSAGSATSNDAFLTVTAAASAPVFTTQPAAQSAAPGSSVTFSAVASGTPAPTYQWRKDGTAISGATDASYTISSVSTAHAGTYSVVATNTVGSATSNGVALAVSAVVTVPIFTTQPSSQTIGSSQGATFSVAASGTSNYQWQRLPAGSTTWEDLHEGGSYRGVATASMSVSSATAAMSGDQFRCVTTNSAGSSTSSSVTLTVNTAAALLQYPAGITRDNSGNLYVADASSNIIRKISTAGVVTTFAGTAGAVGSADGIGSSARFNQPNGMAIDPAGSLYVADTGNGTIRKIASDGTVTTLAGSASTRGSNDGTGSAALFNQPSGVAVDQVGNVYVADTYNATIRKITQSGVVSTLAGAAGSRGELDGTGSAARFNYPNGIAVDSAGNIYVADTYNDTIRKITPAGAVTTLAGSAGISGSTDLSGTNALFNQPSGLAVDAAGNVYVVDTGNATVRKIAPGGAVTTLAGVAGVAGLADSASGADLFNQPHALVVDASGNLYVADTGNAAIRRVTADGTVTTIALSAPQSSETPPPTTPSTPPTSSYSPATPAVSGGGGGGGGAVSLWFLGALVAAGAVRRLRTRKP